MLIFAVAAAFSNCGYDKVQMLPGMNLGGSDRRHFATPSAQACLDACCEDAICGGFTFTTYQPPSPQYDNICPTGSSCCWLKTKPGGILTKSRSNCFLNKSTKQKPFPPIFLIAFFGVSWHKELKNTRKNPENRRGF
jgi:hypothetical protein